MPVRDLVGPVVCLLLGLLLILCLCQTREQFGRTEWGFYWLGRRGAVHFGSPIWPLIHVAIPTVPLGYWLGLRVQSWRCLMWAGIGFLMAAVTAAIFGWVLLETDPTNPKRGGFNFIVMLVFVAGLAGAAACAEFGISASARRKRRKAIADIT